MQDLNQECLNEPNRTQNRVTSASLQDQFPLDPIMLAGETLKLPQNCLQYIIFKWIYRATILSYEHDAKAFISLFLSTLVQAEF